MPPWRLRPSWARIWLGVSCRRRRPRHAPQVLRPSLHDVLTSLNCLIVRWDNCEIPNLEVRLAAIYVLREVAKDFPDLSGPIFELLQAYLRVGKINYGDEEPPIDIREIVSLLRNRLEKPDA